MSKCSIFKLNMAKIELFTFTKKAELQFREI